MIPFTLPGSPGFLLHLFLRQNGRCHRYREASNEAEYNIDLHMTLAVHLLRSVDDNPINEAVDDGCRQILRVTVLACQRHERFDVSSVSMVCSQRFLGLCQLVLQLKDYSFCCSFTTPPSLFTAVVSTTFFFVSVFLFLSKKYLSLFQKEQSTNLQFLLYQQSSILLYQFLYQQFL